MAIKNEALKAAIIRIFNVYGPGEEYCEYRSVVCLFIYKLLKNLPVTIYANAHRSFLFIDDWVNAVSNFTLVHKNIVSGTAINLGSSEYITIEKLFEAISKHIPETRSEILFLYDDEKANIKNKLPNTDRAKKLLGFSCRTSLEEGIKKTVDWMRAKYE